MEEFEKIDWIPSVEDIIDEKFLDEERLQKEGAMYSLMNGTFRDPFEEIRGFNYTPYKNQIPKKTNQNTGNNASAKKTNQNAGNNGETPKRPRGRPKKIKN